MFVKCQAHGFLLSICLSHFQFDHLCVHEWIGAMSHVIPNSISQIATIMHGSQGEGEKPSLRPEVSVLLLVREHKQTIYSTVCSCVFLENRENSLFLFKVSW